MEFTAPTFNARNGSNYPMGGAKLAPAWQAGWDALADRKWKMSDALIKIMVEAGGVTPRTAHNLLCRARSEGLIEVRYRKYGSSKRVRIHSYRRPVASKASGAERSVSQS